MKKRLLKMPQPMPPPYIMWRPHAPVIISAETELAARMLPNNSDNNLRSYNNKLLSRTGARAASACAQAKPATGLAGAVIQATIPLDANAIVRAKTSGAK